VNAVHDYNEYMEMKSDFLGFVCKNYEGDILIDACKKYEEEIKKTKKNKS